MKRRRVLLILLSCVAVVTLAVIVWPREREPEYKGVPLSKWVTRYGGYNLEVRDAVRHMGTNALPYLLRWFQYERPAWKKQLDRAVWAMPASIQSSKSMPWLTSDKAEVRADMAGLAIAYLKPEISLPALEQICSNSTTMVATRRAQSCIRYINIRSQQGDFSAGNTW